MKKVKILLVDDQPEVLGEEKRILGKIPVVELYTADTGAGAIQSLVKYRPDVVFLDLILPDLNGEQILRVIRSKEELKNTVVVVVTARGDQEQFQRAFLLGCDAYVTKPFDENDLLTKVRMILSEKGIFYQEEETP